MANHIRRQIRDAALAALTGLATTGSNAFANRLEPLPDGKLPALLIFTNDEDLQIESMGVGRVMERTLKLNVDICVKENDTFDDKIDQILKEVEIAIAANQGMGGAKYVQLIQIQIETGEGDRNIGVAHLAFDVLYYTQIGVPDVAL